MTQARKTVHPAIFLIFFLSGATALVYEVLWTRLLTTHVFGTTAHAVSTVLAAFMGGLALGAYLIRDRAEREPRPQRLYALLEVVIGLYAIAFPLLLRIVVAIYVSLARDKDPSTGLGFVRFALAFALLLIPATCMGATLPTLARYVGSVRERLGRGLGFLYALNTFGAVVGTLLAAFLLIRVFGVYGTLIGAGIFNLALAAAAWFLPGEAPVVAPETDPAPETTEVAFSPQIVRAAVSVFGISGLCALAYEVLWTRILVFFLGTTTYAFATMLAAFLFGIAFGSAIGGRIADRTDKLPRLLGYAQALIGISAIVLLPIFSELYGIVRAIGVGGRLTVFLVCVVLMLVPTTLMGACFPLAAKIAARGRSDVARVVGRMYALNTLGAIEGSLVAGFALTPMLGIRNSILLIALLNLMAAGWILVADKSLRPFDRWLPTGAGVVMLAAAWLFFPQTQFFVKSSIYQEQFSRVGESAKILSYEEEGDASITVIEDSEGARRLYVDTNEAANDTRWDAPSHRVIAHVPLLLHPNPKRALVVGFGMGRTSNSIIQHGVEVDAVEISAGVPRAAKTFFSDKNNDVLDSPLFHLHINDGRNFILTTRNRYDMISTGIIHPLVSSGSSAIYSKEFYELCKSLLTENGVMSQWVPLHRLPETHFKAILRTFLAVFPHTTVWYKYTPDFLILIGTNHPQTIDLQDWIHRTQEPKIAADLADDDLDTWSLLDSYFMGTEATRAYVGSGPLHTDAKPYLEFFGANLGGIMTTQAENIRGMSAHRERVFPLLENFADARQRAIVKARLDRYYAATNELIKGQALFAEGKYEEAANLFQAASLSNPDDRTLLYNLQEATRVVVRDLDTQISTTERALQEKLRQNPQDVETLTNLGLMYRNAQRVPDAIQSFERALALKPNSVELLLALGETFAQSGQVAKAIPMYERAAKLAPDQIVIHGSLSVLYETVGEVDKAIRSTKEVLRVSPNHALGHSQLGSLLLANGDLNAAAASYETALRSQPEPAVAAIAANGLGTVRMEQKRYADAVAAFRSALEYDPNFVEARENLSQAEAELR